MLGFTAFGNCKCRIFQEKLTFHNNDSLKCHILKYFFSWAQRPKNATLYLKDSLTYIYIYAVGSITWPHFGHFKVNNLATVGSITWPPFFEPIKIGVWGDFFLHSFQGVVQN